ncbi:dnaJ [Symbiodinium natans]|uniref:DnaJ protein n=1 Tax=Symbiodinium natans TaxID=878477 RepID=A0A812R5F3_9DINO|nr:dnaJ [Symbiodinium natans]
MKLAASQTLYNVLGVSRQADNAQIRQAYRHLALATHPDKGGSADEFLKVVEAFEVLSDAQKRATYDEDLQRTGSQDGRGDQSAAERRREAEAAQSAQADAFGLPDLGKTDPDQKPCEGWGVTEETKRAKALWLELLEESREKRAERVLELSCRAAEVLLAYARSNACLGGAPMVGLDAGSAMMVTEVVDDVRAKGVVLTEDEGCGSSLLAMSGAGPDSAADMTSAPRDAEPEPHPAKRRRRDTEAAPLPGAGGSRAWISLGRLKICTGASGDVAEAINWHILLVRVKQLFNELTARGQPFSSAARRAVSSALAERDAEGGGTDPRLRFITECSTGSDQVLFTPVTWDLETALRQNEELSALLAASASRAELLAAIQRMTVASKAAEEEQRALADCLEQHLRHFQRQLRWRGGARPRGVNANICRVVGPSYLGDRGQPEKESKRQAFAYAELWHQRKGASEPEQLEPLCRGPRRRRAEEAMKDLRALQVAQSAGGDAAAKAEARKLFEEAMRASLSVPTRVSFYCKKDDAIVQYGCAVDILQLYGACDLFIAQRRGWEKEKFEPVEKELTAKRHVQGPWTPEFEALSEQKPGHDPESHLLCCFAQPNHAPDVRAWPQSRTGKGQSASDGAVREGLTPAFSACATDSTQNRWRDPLEEVGAIIMFFAARMCHIAFVTSIDARRLEEERFAILPSNFMARLGVVLLPYDQFRETGKADYTAFMKTHPETISETFGDEGTSEGQMVKAIVLPSCIIMAIGGIMMRCGGSSMIGYAFHAARGLLTPFGLLMVLQTPVVSGAKGGNKDIRAGKKVSSVELLYQMNWVMLHMIGFFAFLGPAVLIELPVAIYEITTGADGLGSMDEGIMVKHYRMVLAVMRVLCAVLLVFAAPFLATAETKNPNTLGALKWRAEFTVGEFGATQMYFNALSVFFQPGVGPYSWLDLTLLGLLSLEAFRIFFVHGVFWLVVMKRWDSIDWSAEMKRRVPAQGPVMQGLRTLTGDELTHMHAVQAGVPDFSEWIIKASKYLPASMVATGCKYDKFRLLVVKPDNYENFRAMEFHELSADDLNEWNKDLCRVSKAFESTDTIFFPYGLYKMAGR